MSIPSYIPGYSGRDTRTPTQLAAEAKAGAAGAQQMIAARRERAAGRAKANNRKTLYARDL